MRNPHHDLIKSSLENISPVESQKGSSFNSTMFRWEPEGGYHCTKSMAIAPLWFSMEHPGIVIAPFWFLANDIETTIRKSWLNIISLHGMNFLTKISLIDVKDDCYRHCKCGLVFVWKPPQSIVICTTKHVKESSFSHTDIHQGICFVYNCVGRLLY